MLARPAKIIQVRQGLGFLGNASCTVLIAFASFLGISTSIFAEAKALWMGLSYARYLGITHFWIESDSAFLVNYLNGFFETPWSIIYLVHNILELLENFIEYNISYINREDNNIVDSLAN